MRVLWLFRLRSRIDVIADRPSLSLAPLFPKDDGSLLTTVPRVLICEGGRGRGDVRIRPSLALFKKSAIRCIRHGLVEGVRFVRAPSWCRQETKLRKMTMIPGGELVTYAALLYVKLDQKNEDELIAKKSFFAKQRKGGH